MQEQNYITPPPIISDSSANQNYSPTIQPSSADDTLKSRDLIKTIALIVLGVVSAIFIGLFIWMYLQWNDAKTNLDGQISEAVAIAVDENTTELESDFADREKNPYKTFAGPTDYGELSFGYPKTWSVYEASDASDGKDYEAYFNPDKVPTITKTVINALRVSIVNQTLEEVLSDYNKGVEKGETTARATQVNGENATIYEGQITKELVGRVAIFRIRDKTVIMQTDAAIFYEDFDKILGTVSFNK